METLLEKHWHHLEPATVLELLGSDAERGLDTHEYQRRAAHFGPNQLTPKEGRSPLVRFLLQFHQPLVYILLGAGAITALLSEWVDAGVILGVVIVNAIIGYVQEARAVAALEALARTVKTEATVIRAGERRRVDASMLVPGDIVVLQSGDKVPADIRLVVVKDLQTDESALTGESLPVQKVAAAQPRETVLADRSSMAYASSFVTFGQATGVVIATGDHTELGQISDLLAEATALETPLTRKIGQFSHRLLHVILALAAMTFAVGVYRGEDAVSMLMAAVALTVGAIPEGLPAALTITLAIGVSRMARRRAVIRRLPAVETLGGTTVICSDKTGTLTRNQMTVQRIAAGGAHYDVSGTGYALSGSIVAHSDAPEPQRNAALQETLVAGLLCNDSDLHEENGLWAVHGDPTEGALITAAAKAGFAASALRRSRPRLDAIPFESERQYMASAHRGPAGEAVLYVKGAVEVVLARCATALGADGNPAAFDPRAAARDAEAMAADGQRVLAFALKREGVGETIGAADVDQLVFLGLQGMIDPPRPEAVTAVAVCQAAGIAVKMITGDHLVTARAIAARIGILAGETNPAAPERALPGAELASLSDAELAAAVDDTAVFARVTPEQKLRLVQALQDRGHVVAMTGDGVNDAPALKTANIGIAMGITGTEVAREAADMILTDDNFTTIEAAVEEGRGVFDNLTKFIVWTLPTNLGEGLVILLAVFLGIAMPILPVQILWINMTTAVLLGLMLAFEPKEPGLMERRPRRPDTPILDGALLLRIVLVGTLLMLGSFGLFELLQLRGASLAEARTAAVNVFVVGELFYLFNCRSLRASIFRVGLLSNPSALFGALAMLVLQLLFTYLPAMNRVFHSAPIGAAIWGYITLSALVICVAVEIEKEIRRRLAAGR